MVNYRVDNLDALLAKLREEGVDIADERHQDENGRFAWVTDPEGHRIELWEPADGH
jgi:predicted enzyme related to lactoylglutathione lyase